jgi:hypothetical protein
LPKVVGNQELFIVCCAIINDVGTRLKEPQPDRAKLVTDLKNLGKTLANSRSKL